MVLRMSDLIPLCTSADLQEGGLAVDFDVAYAGEACRAFAVRFDGKVFAYLNRCTHIPMELDYQHNQFFDDSGQWLLCSTHGAAYAPDTGECAGGPCGDNLIRIDLLESDGQVSWQSHEKLKPLAF